MCIPDPHIKHLILKSFLLSTIIISLLCEIIYCYLSNSKENNLPLLTKYISVLVIFQVAIISWHNKPIFTTYFIYTHILFTYSIIKTFVHLVDHMIKPIAFYGREIFIHRIYPIVERLYKCMKYIVCVNIHLGLSV